MCIAVALGMTIPTPMLRKEFVERHRHIVDNIRIGIFIDSDRRRSMRAIHRNLPSRYLRLTNSDLDFISDIDHLASTFGMQLETLIVNLHSISSNRYICSTTSIPNSSLSPWAMIFAVSSHSNTLVGRLSASAINTGQAL